MRSTKSLESPQLFSSTSEAAQATLVGTTLTVLAPFILLKYGLHTCCSLCSSTCPTASHHQAQRPHPRYHSSPFSFRNQVVNLPGVPGLAPCHIQEKGCPTGGCRERPSAKQAHASLPRTHLRNETTVGHCVEAELGHMLGPRILGPPAYQQEEMWSFL